MNLPFFIAKRYFRSKKKQNFISIISIISMIGVGVGTMALVIVLSVFNGLEDLLRSLYNSFDPELKVTLDKGKAFATDEDFLNSIRSMEGVAFLTEVIEDNALIKYQESQNLIKLKGVSENYFQQYDLKNHLLAGEVELTALGNVNYALIGQGVKNSLSIVDLNDFFSLKLFYPKKDQRLSLSSPKLFNEKRVRVGGVFALERQYDENYVFVPLRVAEELMEYDNKRTSLEIKTTPAVSIEMVQEKLEAYLKLSSDLPFLVLNSDQQHSSLLKAIKIEKLFIFLTLSFIIAVASFNIFFSLTMLAIDKKKDMAILYAMGASDNTVRNIFIFEGIIIALTGALSGLFLGLMVCLLQMKYGLVSMGMETSVLDAYPVKLQWTDFVLTAISIIVITFLASFRPATLATKSKFATH